MNQIYSARNFSKNSYDINDKWGKDLFILHLIKKHFIITESKENFDHDIKAIDFHGQEFLFEIEVKTGYPFKNSKTFPFPTVSFTGRKKRLHDIQEFLYVIICRETQWAIIAKSSDIYNNDYTEELYIDTGVRTGYDEFYRVPLEKCRFFKL